MFSYCLPQFQVFSTECLPIFSILPKLSFSSIGITQQLSELSSPTTRLPNSVSLSPVGSARNLGVILNTNLSYAQHISWHHLQCEISSQTRVAKFQRSPASGRLSRAWSPPGALPLDPTWGCCAPRPLSIGSLYCACHWCCSTLQCYDPLLWDEDSNHGKLDRMSNRPYIVLSAGRSFTCVWLYTTTDRPTDGSTV